MKKIREIFFLNRYFFAGFFSFLTASIFFLLSTSRANSFLDLNFYHTRFLDIFFINCTNLGDGLFTIGLVVLLLVIRRFHFALQILSAFLISGLIVQVLKNFISSPRPKTFFKQNAYNYFIDGVTHVGSSSFPSGHAATIFALATMLALYTKNKKISCLYLIAAILVGYSRIYLAQHFPGDVLAGAVIGVLVAILVYSLFNRKMNLPKRRDAVVLRET